MPWHGVSRPPVQVMGIFISVYPTYIRLIAQSSQTRWRGDDLTQYSCQNCAKVRSSRVLYAIIPSTVYVQLWRVYNDGVWCVCLAVFALRDTFSQHQPEAVLLTHLTKHAENQGTAVEVYGPITQKFRNSSSVRVSCRGRGCRVSIQCAGKAAGQSNPTREKKNYHRILF